MRAEISVKKARIWIVPSNLGYQAVTVFIGLGKPQYKIPFVYLDVNSIVRVKPYTYKLIARETIPEKYFGLYHYPEKAHILSAKPLPEADAPVKCGSVYLNNLKVENAVGDILKLERVEYFEGLETGRFELEFEREICRLKPKIIGLAWKVFSEYVEYLGKGVKNIEEMVEETCGVKLEYARYRFRGKRKARLEEIPWIVKFTCVFSFGVELLGYPSIIQVEEVTYRIMDTDTFKMWVYGKLISLFEHPYRNILITTVNIPL